MERLGVGFSAGLSPAEVVECVILAEELGYESAWVAEGHGGDQFSVLTACATATSRILLGTSITSVFVRSAPTIAMAAATVDYLSQGRFILGLGTSHKVQVGPEHGLEFSRAVPRLKECMDIVRRLIKDGEVSYQGEIFNIDRFDLWFEPVRRQMPIFVAAVFPKMLETCGEISDGAILTFCTVGHAEAAAHHVAIGAKRAGKSPEDVEVSTLLPCAISPDKSSALDGIRTNIAHYAARFPRYRRLIVEAGFAEETEAVRQAWLGGRTEEALKLVPEGLIDKIGLIGTATEARERLSEYRRAGITLPIISPRVSGKDAKDLAMETLRACAPQ
jgi:probable F420-dependent oxidoreductase